MYTGFLSLACCKSLISKYKWLNHLLIAFYLIAKYLTALRRGRIDRPCMRQFITVCIGGGLVALYYATDIRKDINVYIHELFLIGIMIATMYVYTRVNAKAQKPDTEYLLSQYSKIHLPAENPEDCVVCLELVTFIQTAMKCKYCKHVFHKTCLHRWCDESATCPHCRHEYH